MTALTDTISVFKRNWQAFENMARLPGALNRMLDALPLAEIPELQQRAVQEDRDIATWTQFAELTHNRTPAVPEEDWRTVQRLLSDVVQTSSTLATIDITEIDELAASRHRVEEPTLEQWAQTLCPCPSLAEFRDYLEDIFQYQPITVRKQTWRQRTTWIDDDGSHRFAVAREFALKHNLIATVSANIETQTLSYPRIAELQKCARFYLLPARDEDDWDIFSTNAKAREIAGQLSEHFELSIRYLEYGYIGSKRSFVALMLKTERDKRAAAYLAEHHPNAASAELTTYLTARATSAVS